MDAEELAAGDTVSWMNRHRMRTWGLVEYTDSEGVHVRVPGIGTQKMRYTIQPGKIDKHWKGRSEYDRHL